MGIDWNWIFQRPQILALELQKQYEVTVLCPRQFVQNKHQKRISCRTGWWNCISFRFRKKAGL